jgi:hypothetical protein
MKTKTKAAANLKVSPDPCMGNFSDTAGANNCANKKAAIQPMTDKTS